MFQDCLTVKKHEDSFAQLQKKKQPSDVLSRIKPEPRRLLYRLSG